MRIAIGQLWQETNTFNPLPTTIAEFEAFGIYEGEELVSRMAKTNEPGGFIQSLHDWAERPEIVGLVRFAAWPSDDIHRVGDLCDAIEKSVRVELARQPPSPAWQEKVPRSGG